MWFFVYIYYIWIYLEFENLHFNWFMKDLFIVGMEMFQTTDHWSVSLHNLRNSCPDKWILVVILSIDAL